MFLSIIELSEVDVVGFADEKLVMVIPLFVEVLSR